MGCLRRNHPPPPPPEIATAGVGIYPTGMHSCLTLFCFVLTQCVQSGCDGSINKPTVQCGGHTSDQSPADCDGKPPVSVVQGKTGFCLLGSVYTNCQRQLCFDNSATHFSNDTVVFSDKRIASAIAVCHSVDADAWCKFILLPCSHIRAHLYWGENETFL